mmetsp:Transcript_102639/g.265792  ORF Transcript_102639/g.265792 Transcript_102639/m.265792 type:complete len:252 (-) Transcript_102639:328-1083(-)
MQLVAAYEERPLTLGGVEKHALVSIRDVTTWKRVRVAHIQHHRHAPVLLPPRQLVVDLQVDCLVRLDSHDELVPGAGHQSIVRFFLERDADLGHPLIEALAGSHEEGDTTPTIVVDLQGDCGKCGTSRIFWHAWVVEVPWLLVRLSLEFPGAPPELPQKAMLQGQSPDRFEKLAFFLLHVRAVERRGRLHGEPEEDLEQMVLHDVPDDAGLIEVAATATCAQVFLEHNLDMLDVVAVPQRLEDLVTKPQRH